MKETLVSIYSSLEGQFMLKVALSILFGTVLGMERQSKGKDAGVRTYCYII